MSRLSRRDFLSLIPVSVISALFPLRSSAAGYNPSEPFSLTIDQLPPFVQEIINRIPRTTMSKDGYLAIVNEEGEKATILQRRTAWNLENTKPYNELKNDLPWGIVLHWFGDKFNQQQDLDFYMRGFNGRRILDGVLVMTSAHFLVGDLYPDPDPTSKTFGIVQTQKPTAAGIPYQAAHISPLDRAAYERGENYFISALYQLKQAYPGLHLLLQDFYEQRTILPHMHTIAIEISGHSFEDPNYYPCTQKIANVLSVVWAIMKRYRIPAKDIMGHFEIQLTKPDPGKKFLALVKYLIGIKALLENDDEMNALVFEPFQTIKGIEDPVIAYFKYIRDYLLLTAYPKQIYEWDAWSKFPITFDTILGQTNGFLAETFFYPVPEPYWFPGKRFLDPGNHEGVDFYPDWRGTTQWAETQPVHLIANGVCVFIGETTGFHDGGLAVFKHRQRDGSEVISLYAHLQEIRGIKVGGKYPAGRTIGTIKTSRVPPYGYLHFSLAYGPSWELQLHKDPNLPLNAGPTWIQIYYLDPVTYLGDVRAKPYDPLNQGSHIPT